MKIIFSNISRLFCFILALQLFFPALSFAQDQNSEQIEEPASVTTGKSFNVKVSPSLFWGTIGVEVEYQFHKAYTVSLNSYYKIGRTEGKSVSATAKDENYLEDGLRGELAFRYFPAQKAPSGFYYQAHVGYGNILYFDGTNKPFTINSRWKPDADIREPLELNSPKPYSGGLGVGYQIVIPSRHIIANITGGLQGNFGPKNQPYLSFFLAPSIGIIF